MTRDEKQLRLYGVYRQGKDDHHMLRVKIPAGLLTCDQAETICALSEQHSNSMLHLTSRGSIEFHWLRQDVLEETFARLAAVGLTTRGACGGAVRGISCSTTFSPDYAIVQRVAGTLNRHFAGNPDFEGLPKKFKVGVDAGYQGARHLVQDLGFVLVDGPDTDPAFDVWCAGGLGREPQAAFLLEEAVPEARLIPLIEAVVQVYRDNTPPPKRLKFLLNTIGEEAFRRHLATELARRPQTEHALAGDDTPPPLAGGFVEIPVFAGEIEASRLRTLAAVAQDAGNGALAVTTDQNIALPASSTEELQTLRQALADAGVAIDDPEVLPRFRVCPGSHECPMGLVPTREIARRLTSSVPSGAREKSWALSGCRNSCSQPQLADYGIVTSRLQKNADGSRVPRFDLYRRDDDGLGRRLAEDLAVTDLCARVRALD